MRVDNPLPAQQNVGLARKGLPVSNMALIKVTDRDGVEHDVEGNTKFTLMENLRDLEYGVAAVCGGMCACATCHVYIEPDRQTGLPPRSYEELVMLEDLDSFDAERSRLSCQIKVGEACEGLELEVAPEE
jgi:2Fe-2S ferredoxin